MILGRDLEDGVDLVHVNLLLWDVITKQHKPLFDSPSDLAVLVSCLQDSEKATNLIRVGANFMLKNMKDAPSSSINVAQDPKEAFYLARAALLPRQS
jgi:hypothetical protein